MAAKLKQTLNLEAELIRGGGGIFDIELENERIYSKHETGQFPTEEEIVERLQARLAADPRR